jgi:hypothetical protein
MTMTAPRILDDCEAHNLLLQALSTVIAATPDQVLVIGRDGLRDRGSVFIEVLETGAVCFTLDNGRRQ